MTKLFSKLFGGLSRRFTDQLFPRYYGLRDARLGIPALPPLNGQHGRQAIVERIIKDCSIEQIIETGTYRGATTKWLLQFKLPIHSVEANPRFAEYVRRIFAAEPLIRLAEMDSAAFLEQLGRHPVVTSRRTLFYLDAHWGRHLPLAQEIRAVVRGFPDAVMLVDDFCVADDPGYGFDDYGPRMRLDLDYVRDAGLGGLRVFFPTLRGDDEDGNRRGCVVLTTCAALGEMLSGIPLLRPYPPL